ELLEQMCTTIGSDASLVWTDEQRILDADVQPWTELPLWLPGSEYAGMARADISRALAAGLVFRPLEETVADTLAWDRTVPVDGLVLARSVFNHSVNYRSAVVLGTATLVEGEEKLTALRALTEQLAPGRWDEARQPTATELKATWILSLPLDEASAKVRTGPEEDEPEDL